MKRILAKRYKCIKAIKNEFEETVVGVNQILIQGFMNKFLFSIEGGKLSSYSILLKNEKDNKIEKFIQKGFLIEVDSLNYIDSAEYKDNINRIKEDIDFYKKRIKINKGYLKEKEQELKYLLDLNATN